MDLRRELGLATGTLVVMASMIGTGIFITSGSLLEMTGSVPWVLVLWAVGGFVALAGSLSYAELAAQMPESGGEYIYLREVFGFLPAFLTGWVSLIVGFSAPIATSALAFAHYLERSFVHVLGEYAMSGSLLSSQVGQKGIAITLVILLGLLHMLGVKEGSRTQNVLTILKVALVMVFLGLGALAADWTEVGRLAAYSGPVEKRPDVPTLGLALLMVSFSYSGWNGASYLAGEIKDPERNLPRALFWGTGVTTGLYLALNAMFMMSAPIESLAGKTAIAATAAGYLFDPGVAAILDVGIMLVLLSSVSVQIMVGPRVYFAMARDRVIFSGLGKVSPRFGTPLLAVATQMGLSVVYILIGKADLLLQYMGFALNIFPVFSVAGLLWLRWRHPERERPYHVFGYPWVPLLFIVGTTAMMAAALMAWTETSKFAIGVVLAGIPVFYIWRWRVGDPRERSA